MKLTLKHKSAYGRDIFEPVCENSKLLLKLKGKDVKSFTILDLRVLQSLNVEIEIISSTFNLAEVKSWWL